VRAIFNLRAASAIQHQLIFWSARALEPIDDDDVHTVAFGRECTAHRVHVWVTMPAPFTGE
jgi:hypothetical protein